MALGAKAQLLVAGSARQDQRSRLTGTSLTPERPRRLRRMQRRQFLQGVLSSPMIAAAWKQGLPAAFESEIVQWMGVAPVPGAIIGVVRNGGPAWLRPLGVRHIETNDPVTRDTIFQAASLSKQVTAYAAFALRDAGKLDFDRTLVSYVDDLADERARKVTVRQVLSHSSGFPNWRSGAVKQLVPEFEPGSKFQYSGEGFFYLQRVLEYVTGLGFCDVIDRQVFQPLGMTSSSMIWRPELANRYALPHDRRGEVRTNWDKGARRLHEIAKQRGQTVTGWRYADYESATREAGRLRPVSAVRAAKPGNPPGTDPHPAHARLGAGLGHRTCSRSRVRLAMGGQRWLQEFCDCGADIG